MVDGGRRNIALATGSIRRVTVEDSPQLTNYQVFRTPITLTNSELTLVLLS
jgi:hypothetical protein